MWAVYRGSGLAHFVPFWTRYVPAGEVALLAQSEIILSPLWVWLFINEVLFNPTGADTGNANGPVTAKQEGL